VTPRAGLDDLKTRKFLTFDPLVVQPIASRYTDCALTALLLLLEFVNAPPMVFHLIVVVGFQYSQDPESYAGGSVAAGRGTRVGEVKG
jgi:hypothetical protein